MRSSSAVSRIIADSTLSARVSRAAIRPARRSAEMARSRSETLGTSKSNWSNSRLSETSVETGVLRGASRCAARSRARPSRRAGNPGLALATTCPPWNTSTSPSSTMKNSASRGSLLREHRPRRDGNGRREPGRESALVLRESLEERNRRGRARRPGSAVSCAGRSSVRLRDDTLLALRREVEGSRPRSRASQAGHAWLVGTEGIKRVDHGDSCYFFEVRSHESRRSTFRELDHNVSTLHSYRKHSVRARMNAPRLVDTHAGSPTLEDALIVVGDLALLRVDNRPRRAVAFATSGSRMVMLVRGHTWRRERSGQPRHHRLDPRRTRGVPRPVRRALGPAPERRSRRASRPPGSRSPTCSRSTRARKRTSCTRSCSSAAATKRPRRPTTRSATTTRSAMRSAPPPA